MADAPTAVEDPLSSLPIPPLIFSDDLTLPDDFLDFDFHDLGITFDDQPHPSNSEQFFNSTSYQSHPFDPSSSHHQFVDFGSDHVTAVAESGNLSDNCLLDTYLSGNEGLDVSEFVNVSSPDDYVSGRGFGEESLRRFSDNLCSELNRNVTSSDSSNSDLNQNVRSSNSGNSVLNPNVTSSDDTSNSGFNQNVTSDSPGNSVANENVKRETMTNFVLKRKFEGSNMNLESRTVTATEIPNQVHGEDEKKKARLIRNRESAQLSRQRKKQYVEELEDKVRGMQAIIQDLNARITYIAAENATLKQQMVCTGAGAGVCAPPVMAPMGYPWMPYPPYVVKPQGSQVPLVPIPRLSAQQSAQQSKTDVKKTGGTLKTKIKTKTKKVASISFLGLLLFIVLFGGLVPIMNVKFGGVSDGGYYVKRNDYKYYNQQHYGRVLMGDELEHVNGTNRNASEPLVASLYVPRNDKLVKIDGSLIISSVLASEKAMASRKEQEITKKEHTGSALVPAIPIPTVHRNEGRQPCTYRTLSDHQRALPSNEENLQSKQVDGKLQQWFREDLSGLMLSSGMCTEVFQFDTSVTGAIVPTTSAVNITATKNRNNSTYITTVKNRRILHGLPIPLSDSTTNITKEQVTHHDSKHEDHLKNKPVSSMVVSVLVDPREVGDGGDLDSMMGGGGGKGNSFSRIFVVVLLDSVKYVTYSCMLPLKGTSHLVKA